MPAVIINPDLPNENKFNLKKSGFDIIELELCSTVDRPIAGHPDIQLFQSNDILFLSCSISDKIKSLIDNYTETIRVDYMPSGKYPNDCRINILHYGNIAFHKREITHPDIVKYFKENNISLINTNQGYAACSSILLNDVVITSDPSTLKSAAKEGIKTIEINSGNIILPNYNYGFIGGCIGIYENNLYFTGNLDKHPDKNIIVNAVTQAGFNIIELSKNTLFDSGSLFFIG